MKCEKCGERIPKGRLDVLPDTKVCVRCSGGKRRTIDDVEIDVPDREEMARCVQG